jgi:RNA polymerase sigma-70 factor (ECF subfamily)
MNGRNFAAPVHGAGEHVAPGELGVAAATLDVPSFRAIYDRYFDFVWSSARRLGVKPGALDDVVQEIFMVIHGKIDTLRQPESLRSWIYSIARRTVSGYHRSQRTRGVSDIAFALHVESQQEPPLTPLELTEHNEDAKLLWELLGEVDLPKREVLMLVELDGMTVPEISEALEIPLNTAYSRLRAARFAFEAALARRTARERRGSTP